MIRYLLLPVELRDAAGIPPGTFLEAFARNPTLITAGYLIFALGSLLGIAAVLAISDSARFANEGWARWASALATIGFAVNTVDWLRLLALNPARAAAYVQGDAAVRAALTVPGALAGLDPAAFLRFGAVGLWILVVSLLAPRGVGVAVTPGAWPEARSRREHLEEVFAVVNILEARFGEAYRQYKRTVPRWFGRPWRK